MTNKESYIRAIIATLLILYAFLSNSFFLGAIAIIIFYTAYMKFCFIYHIFHINERFGIYNYYLSLLPKYRTSPVYIFDIHGKIIFENETAKYALPEIQSAQDLQINDIDSFIENKQDDKIIYEHEEQYFQVELRGIKKEHFMLAYFNDITEVMQLNQEIEHTQREVIYAMGEIGETRSKETGNHVKRVAKYSRLLAKLYGLGDKESDELEMASPMHDIGKVGIPDAILNAPRKLTQKEFEVMKTHAELGYNMLKHSDKAILRSAAIVAHQHHEKYDGSGYPRGLRGEDIHIYGRITAVADVFDALGSERVYKKAWKLDDILALFKQEQGKHFDPKLVDIFFENLNDFLKIRDTYQDKIEG